MVYKNQLVATIKSGGKILREYDNSVLLPWGAEYSVYCKNLSSVRALVSVSIDGTDVTEGTQFIIEPNSSLELERFIRNGNFDRGNKFRFIELTSEIEQHRGIKADDGIVRVSYRFEKPVYKTPEYNPGYVTWQGGSGGMLRAMNVQGNINNPFHYVETSYSNDQGGAIFQNTVQCNTMSAPSTTAAAPGITVPGSESDQKFVLGSWFPTEDTSHVIVLQLRGAVVGKPVVQAVTVDHKPKCSTCRRVNKAKAKFCSECGTALQLI